MQALENENYNGYYDRGQGGKKEPPARPTSFTQKVGNMPLMQGPKKAIKNDVIDNLCSNFNQDLLISKTFYFFFFSAFGSLFPLMAVYFKQMGMNPTQSGILIGIRPLIEFLSAPFWGSLADRFKRGKLMLLFSLGCWIVFTLSLAFVQPPASSCVKYNKTHHFLYSPYSDKLKRSIPGELLETVGNSENWIVETPDDDSDLYKRETDSDTPHIPPGYVVGQSPGSLEYTLNYKKEKHTSYISPSFSSIVYEKADVQEVFFLLLLLVVIGEFFSAPAITMADTVTLSYLADNPDNYGKQRMFGSLGWGLSMFFVGVALDQSTSFLNHPCGPHHMERNYTICFATFSVLMGCALLAATQFKFSYEDEMEDPNHPSDKMQMQAMSNGPDLVQTAGGGITTTATPLPVKEPPKTDSPMGKSKVFAQTTKKIPEVLTVLRTFANIRYGSFLYVAWFMGFGIGLVFTFLFWHLQDLGGTPTLFGAASVINHVSEIFAYFFSFKFIRQIGHVKIISLRLEGYLPNITHDPSDLVTAKLLINCFLESTGITHAAVWAACCSYITQGTPSNLRTSAQGVLQGLHHGLGRGCGSVIGGIFVSYFGTEITFRGYGIACLVVLFAFIFINYYRKDKGFQSFSDEPQEVIEDSAHLAPHGVPANPMPRALSKQNLGGEEKQQYTTDYKNGTNLNLPQQGQYYQQPQQPQQIYNQDSRQNRWDDSANGDLFFSTAPSATTKSHNPQPGNKRSAADYDW
ncbi:Major facilitator superfamily domain-containing protein 6 [Nymphon striatum]|nr:Major facilitator superfamily domain-containing protein 6 [Nymphon striatum]